MTPSEQGCGPAPGQGAGPVVVRYWASLRAAAGVEQDEIAVREPLTVAQALARATERHDTRPFRDLLATCSVLVDGRPVPRDRSGSALVGPGETVELLPPFAGG